MATVCRFPRRGPSSKNSRAAGGQSQRQQRIGLGLAIVRAIVEAHHGKVDVRRTTAAARTFESCFRDGRRRVTEAASSLVVIVEDDAAIAEGLALNLKLQGFRAEVSGDAETALPHIEAAAADLVLLDITLPRQSGLWVLERLREARQQCACDRAFRPARRIRQGWRRCGWAPTTT